MTTMVVDERRTGAAGQATVRLAVIDSDTGFLQVLGKRLEGMGWQHRVLASPVPLDAMVALRLNAVVVDLAVLGPQGWTYLDKLCARLPGLGVIVCTGQSSVAQRVRGLRLGADDWVTKPCHPEELIARIEAVEKGPVVIGEVEIRADQFQAFVAGSSVELTRREYELIQLLAEAEGQVLQREEIYQRVWGYAMVHGDRSVDVFVRKLRSKLEKVSPSWRYIHTHFGIGYRFAAEPVEAPVGESLPVPEPVAGSLPADPIGHGLEAAPVPEYVPAH
jgi:DNA-binding response OmpR family regulator